MGTRRLDRRKYAESVKLLKSVISDSKQPVRRRLWCVETLLGIYDRHTATEARRERQKAQDAREVAASAVPDADGQEQEFVTGTGTGTPGEALREAQEFLAKAIRLEDADDENDDE